MKNIFDMQSMVDEEFESLEGQMLVATPALDKSVFEKSLIYICAHDVAGAVGVIFNSVIDTITTEQILNLNGIKKSIPNNKEYPVFYGGPVDEDRAIVLRYQKPNDCSVDFDPKDFIDVQTNADLFLRDVALGKVKDKFIFAKGICGWAAGQLEEEVSQNVWIPSQPDTDLIFSQRIKKKWDKVVKQIGIGNFSNLVSYSGSA